MIVFTFGQTTKPTEYLVVAVPISFNKVSYHLAWTSHPANNYYKQDYFTKGEIIEKFKRLIMLEFITGKTKLKDNVARKAAVHLKRQVSSVVLKVV